MYRFLNHHKTVLFSIIVFESLLILAILTFSSALAVFLLVHWSGKTEGGSLIGGILYPKESETREVRSLDGIWAFRKDDSQYQGYKEGWYEYPLHETGEVIPMPVPSSYNDITQEKNLRDHVGIVWYERTFFAPERWHLDSLRVWLRFGSVHYHAHVFLNGQKLMSHEIGHLPFQVEVTSKLFYGKINRLTLAVDNVLTSVTVPQGAIETLVVDNQQRNYQTYTFDFFNYAGIHRSVHLYTTPIVYIDDITINTDIENDNGMIYYNITFGGFVTETEEVICTTRLLAETGEEVQGIKKIEENGGQSGHIIIPNATLWWPYMMHPQPGYMYTVEVVITVPKYNTSDVYRQPVGIRTVRWNDKNLLINGKSVYIRGVGKHEDSDIRGKGLDYALITKDFNLLKWLGINTFRTSHYPYAEEIMDFADQQGIMVIDECPSVDTDNFSEELLKKHSTSLAELIRRDKNRPSVIMWSIANEPRSSKQGAGSYFKSVVKFVKTLDTKRPITAAINRPLDKDEAAQYLDIISFNRYNSWYSNTGRLEVIKGRVEEEAASWHKKYNKPVLMSEFGADTIPGLHLEPAYVWSEEYQVRMLSEHFKAFDNLREKGFFIGEMIWNFADFKTAQTYTRVGGNKKGILTRERQPKAAAHHLRLRNFKLAQEIDNYRVPENVRNLEPYTAPGQILSNHIEL